MNPTPYRLLGRSGAVVFEQALGTMTFGAEADEPTSHAIIDAYIEAGGNFIDTADVYSAVARRDHRPMARCAPRGSGRHRHRDQGPVPDRLGPECPRHVSTASAHRAG